MSYRSPSYRAGFASPQRGDMAYPQLWRRCVGAWNMGLGPTGARLFDHSGYGNHGTLTNMDGTDWVASEGKIALDFDGVNDYVNIPRRGSLDVTKELTISAWAKIKVHGSTNVGIVAKFLGFGDQRSYEVGFTSGGNVLFAVSSAGTSATNRIINAGQAVATEIWTHIAATYIPSTSMRSYINGKINEEATTTIPSSIFNSTANIWLGTHFDATNTIYNFEGQIDDVRIYDRAITPFEIAILAQRRGIAYETYRVPIVRGAGGGGGGGFKPYWATRRSTLIGCGV